MYCNAAGVKDLIKVPVDNSVNVDTYITDAAILIDTYLRGIYTLPIAEDEKESDGYILLTKINKELAGAYLLLALSSSAESDSLHEYAKDLEGRALVVLESIKAGETILDGVTIDDDDSDNVIAKPVKILSSSPEDRTNLNDPNSFFNKPLVDVQAADDLRIR
jgi:phage gp36-like protein